MLNSILHYQIHFLLSASNSCNLNNMMIMDIQYICTYQRWKYEVLRIHRLVLYLSFVITAFRVSSYNKINHNINIIVGLVIPDLEVALCFVTVVIFSFPLFCCNMHFLSSHFCFLFPCPPNLGLSKHILHRPQSLLV